MSIILCFRDVMAQELGGIRPEDIPVLRMFGQVDLMKPVQCLGIEVSPRYARIVDWIFGQAGFRSQVNADFAFLG